MTTELYNQEKRQVGTIEMPKTFFGATWKPDLVHQVVVAYVSNARQLTSHTKGRAEVRGGGKKPWAQKHTGRSRQGSIRSPIWKGGGVAHGPDEFRNYGKKVNKKMKRGALASVLSKKLSDKEVTVIDSLDFKNHKTKEVAKMLKNFFDKKPNVLFVSGKSNTSLFVSARNIPNVEIVHARELNAMNGLRHKHIIFEKGAVEELAEVK